MSVLRGLGILLAGLVALLASVHIKGLRYFDRPSLARHRVFDPFLSAVAWALIALGLVMAWRASWIAGFAVTSILAALFVYRRVIRGPWNHRRLLRRDFEAFRRGRPATPDEEVLRELALRRHPEWGPELVEQMVRDYPTVEAFASMLARMERGFRGFRGRRPRVRRAAE